MSSLLITWHLCSQIQQHSEAGKSIAAVPNESMIPLRDFFNREIPHFLVTSAGIGNLTSYFRSSSSIRKNSTTDDNTVAKLDAILSAIGDSTAGSKQSKLSRLRIMTGLETEPQA
jgi:hypothetical protein